MAENGLNSYKRLVICFYGGLSNILCNYFCLVFYCPTNFVPLPVAARCKASVFGCWLAGIAGLSPAGGMDVCLV